MKEITKAITILNNAVENNTNVNVSDAKFILSVLNKIIQNELNKREQELANAKTVLENDFVLQTIKTRCACL